MKINKVIISGGGTGGHIFPAMAIADELKNRNPEIDILFVGAEGKMEMEKVPAGGYKIVGLPIVGFQRSLSLKNLLLPFKLIRSLFKAYKIINKFKPEIVIGVGGYASGPVLQVATKLNYPTLIQEQNSFAGKTNKLLSKSVDIICTAYEGMDSFFPKNKIVLTGNPVRKSMVQIEGKREEAIKHFGLNPEKKTILVIGGSLGSKTINDSIYLGIESFEENDIQVLWQCGKFYYQELNNSVSQKNSSNIFLNEFISRMDLAYASADMIISRAGAISVSELTLIGKPTILVPSPNVAEDHQTKNAMSLVNKNAAILIKDSDSKNTLVKQAISLLNDDTLKSELSENILSLGKPNATEHIVNEIEKILA